MKTLLLNGLFLILCLVGSAGEKFSFDRPLKIHDSFQCRIFTDQSVRYSFLLRGREQPLTRLETLQGSFSGYIRVLALNSRGNASVLQIRMNSAHGSVNGKPVRFRTGKKGILIRGDLSGRNSVFIREGNRSFSAEETALLRAFFPPASSSKISDLTGKEHLLPPPGHSWPVLTDLFLQTLARRQIRLPESSIRGGVTYCGMSRVEKIPCRQFVIRMETDSLKEYDFRLKVTFCMGKDSPVPLKMKREAKEILSRTLNGNDPFSGGSKVELHSQDQTEQWLLPLRGPDRENLWQEFPPENTLAPRGEWRNLLR